jgi:hypothetical protein
MHWREGQNPGIDCVGMGIGLICELCNDSKVTAPAYGSDRSFGERGSTTDGPEEIAVDFGVGLYDFTGRENHFHVTKVVNHHTILNSGLEVHTHIVHLDSRIPRRASILQCQYH